MATLNKSSQHSSLGYKCVRKIQQRFTSKSRLGSKRKIKSVYNVNDVKFPQLPNWTRVNDARDTYLQGSDQHKHVLNTNNFSSDTRWYLQRKYTTNYDTVDTPKTSKQVWHVKSFK